MSPMRSAPSPAPGPPGSPAPPANSASTYPSTGPGRPPGRRCSSPPAATDPGDLTDQPQRARPRTRSGTPGQTVHSLTPETAAPNPVPIKRHEETDTWIEVQAGPRERGIQRRQAHPGRRADRPHLRVAGGRVRLTRTGSGTGLGLAIVKAIVEEHEGRLTLTSVEGEGTTVLVDPPLAAGPDGSPLTQ